MTGKLGSRFFIAGGAGFIGSHFVDSFLASKRTELVTIFDNFSSGRPWHFEQHRHDDRFVVVQADIHDADALRAAMAGHDAVIHLASNPDIARAVTEPDVDFREGTELTHAIVEAMRVTRVPLVLYASGSGVYGDLGTMEVGEDYGPLSPVSTYGASKLAGEALICSYAHMFGMRGLAFRFGNVVGRRQTHGVGFDFIRSLLRNPRLLRILGDGRQSKSYVHVDDVVRAVMTAAESSTRPFEVFNVATGDSITVTEIADLACQCLGLEPGDVTYAYSGGDRGWKGDVPVVRLDIAKICRLGWKPTRSSAQALREAVDAMLADLRAGRDADGTASYAANHQSRNALPV